MAQKHLSPSFSLRLLNSSPEQSESDSWRIGGRSFDKFPTTKVMFTDEDNQARPENSRIHRGQQQDNPADVSGALASSGPGRGQILTTGQGGLLPGDTEGHLIPAKQESQYHSPPRTGQDSDGDKVESSAWSICNRAGQQASIDSTVDRSPGLVKSAGSDNSILAEDNGAKGFNIKVSSREDSMEAREGLSPGGGAFILFRRDTAKQTSTPTRHTMVCCTVFALFSQTTCSSMLVNQNVFSGPALKRHTLLVHYFIHFNVQ